MSAYEVSRSITVDAPPERVHALIDGFRQWVRWSPWEDVDPEHQRSYTGPESGVGARYAWEGNRKAGAGTMEITGSAPARIDVSLTFRRPFPSASAVTFDLVPTDAGTAVTWTMRGRHQGLLGLLGRVVPMDRVLGRDFERGLDRLKAAAEAQPGT